MFNITFENNSRTKKFILGLFGKETDENGYIIESMTKKRILGADGQEITLSDFGVLKNGSEIYAKDDIVSMVSFYEKFLAKN